MLRWLHRLFQSSTTKVRAAFLRNRERMSDQQFLNLLELDDQDSGAMIIFLRRFLGMICSVHPEMIYPSDSTESLEEVIDWGQALFNHWWIPYMDRGQWSVWEFGVRIAREFTTREMRGLIQLNPKKDMPPFGRYPHYGRRRPPYMTLGEWIVEASRIVLQSLPEEARNRIPEYPRGTESRFRKLIEQPQSS